MVLRYILQVVFWLHVTLSSIRDVILTKTGTPGEKSNQDWHRLPEKSESYKTEFLQNINRLQEHSPLQGHDIPLLVPEIYI